MVHRANFPECELFRSADDAASVHVRLFRRRLDQVLSLFATDTDKSRVQFWVDEGVIAANPEIRKELDRRLVSSLDRLELTSPIHYVAGGEQVKNDDETIDRIFRQIDQDGLDRRSYICVIGGGHSSMELDMPLGSRIAGFA